VKRSGKWDAVQMPGAECRSSEHWLRLDESTGNLYNLCAGRWGPSWGIWEMIPKPNMSETVFTSINHRFPSDTTYCEIVFAENSVLFIKEKEKGVLKGWNINTGSQVYQSQIPLIPNYWSNWHYFVKRPTR
jgi:hypothetical protein